MPGVSIETGDTVWDPMNLAQWRDPAEMRECELKNGRAAMLAVVGWIWPQVFGLWAANDVTTTDPIAAIGQVNELAWVQILAACGMVEAADYNFKRTGSTKPFFDPLGLCPTDKAGFVRAPPRARARAHAPRPTRALRTQEKMQLRELKNARMAMIAFAGLVVHHYLPSAVPGMGSLA